jgi:hypothetical protein
MSEKHPRKKESISMHVVKDKCLPSVWNLQRLFPIILLLNLSPRDTDSPKETFIALNRMTAWIEDKVESTIESLSLHVAYQSLLSSTNVQIIDLHFWNLTSHSFAAAAATAAAWPPNSFPGIF